VRHHFWHAALRLCSTIHRQHPPERVVLSHSCCFGDCNMVQKWIKIDPYYQLQKDNPSPEISAMCRTCINLRSEWPLTLISGHNILQRQISRKWYKMEIYLQWLTGSHTWSIEWWSFPWLFLTQIERPTIVLHLVSQKWYKMDAAWLLQTTNRKWYVAYWIVLTPVTLNDLQGRFIYFCRKISVAYFCSLW